MSASPGEDVSAAPVSSAPRSKPTRPAREWISRVTLLAGSTVLALLVAEAGLRAAGLPRHLPGYARIGNTKGGDVRAGTVALVCYPTNPRGYFPIDLRRPQ